VSGELSDGDQLPGENALMERYGVARATARQALSVLINEGLAVARRGSGVYVRAFRPLRRHGSRRLAREGWGAGQAIWDADTDGRAYAPDQITIAEEDPTDLAARALRLDPGAHVLVRRRRYLVEGRPVQLAASYYPAKLVAGTRIAEPDTGPGGVYARLAELGHAPEAFTEELRARMPSPEERAGLALPDGNPVIAVMRTAYRADREPVELNEMVLDAASYVLQYDFKA
jgi:GntR family transcriptional regulator